MDGARLYRSLIIRMRERLDSQSIFSMYFSLMEKSEGLRHSRSGSSSPSPTARVPGVLKRKGCSSARRTTAHRVTPTPERPNVST